LRTRGDAGALPAAPHAGVVTAMSRAAATVSLRSSANANHRGGDIFDIAPDRAGRDTWVLIADASSKGSLGALHAEMIRDAFRAAIAEFATPVAVMTYLNGLRFDSPGPDLRVTFASAIVARISPSTENLCYASAGHDIGLLFSGRAHQHLAPTGPLLGIFRECEYTERTLPFERKALLVLATDGITEARCFAESSLQFGTSGLARAVSERLPHGRVRADDVCARLDAFTNKLYHDDATVAIITAGAHPQRKIRYVSIAQRSLRCNKEQM
jgi:serine phosphatase RsbU (regulator of sigma subunit)